MPRRFPHHPLACLLGMGVAVLAACTDDAFDLCAQAPSPSADCIEFICDNNPQARPDLCLPDGTPIDSLPCHNACSGDTPVCDAASNQCVQCLDASHCPDGIACSDQQCLPSPTCAADSDCPNPALPICANGACSPACSQNAQCQRFPDTPVCHPASGTCVQCTPSSADSDCPVPPGTNLPPACTANGHNGGSHFLCHPDSLTCTDTLAGCSATCDECAFDAACIPDHACVPMAFDGNPVGHFCLFRRPNPDDCGPLKDGPFYDFYTNLTSVDGITDTFCGPETTTTCTGVQSFKRPCDDDNGDPDHDRCGIPGVDDALCRNNQGAFLCTPRCGEDRTCFQKGGVCPESPEPGQPTPICAFSKPQNPQD